MMHCPGCGARLIVLFSAEEISERGGKPAMLFNCEGCRRKFIVTEQPKTSEACHESR